jgi:potassium efflux system protein
MADLRRIEELLRPSAEVARIRSDLLVREAEVVTQRAALDAVDPGQISARQLADLELSWLELERELSIWITVVDARFDALQVERERMREISALWGRTAAQADTMDLPPEMSARVAEVLTAVRDVENRVRERRNDVGASSSLVASRYDLVFISLERINELGVAMRDRLFDRETAPLWSSLGAVSSQPFTGDTLAASRDWAESLLSYLWLRLARILFLALGFLALLFTALHLRRHSEERLPNDVGSERSRGLIERPFSLALASSVAITTVVLPYPVGASTDLIFVFAMVPMLRLGAVILGPEARRKLYLVATLAILERVATIGFDGSTTGRFLLLVVSALGFGAALRAAIRGGKREEEQGGWARARQLVAWSAAFMFAVAAAANIFGWLQLSKMLTEATVSSLFSAFGWSILVTAVATLLPVLLSGWMGGALLSLNNNRATVERITVGVLGIAATFLWLRGAMIRFYVWGPVRNFAARITDSGISIGGLDISTGGVVGAALVLAGAWLVARFIRFVLREEVLPRLDLRQGSRHSLITLVNYTVYGLGIAMAASALGLTGTQLAVVVGALSLGIGFGLQTIVNNFVSGLILIFERPIQVGDTIETTNHFGRVKRIGIRASIIYTYDGAEIVVPNGDLIAKEVINWTRTDEIRRAEVVVGVAYGTDPEAVLEILLRVAEEHSKARKYPEPKAQMINFGDSSLGFRLRCWTPIDDWIDLVSDLHVAINRELKAAGITIPFPQRDLHVIPPAGEAAPDLRLQLDPSDPPD